MRELDGKVSVVTGGASGIGEAICTASARAGMRVVVADVEEAAADAVAETIRSAGGEALAVGVDVRDPEALERLAARSFEQFGGCHLLANNAGVIVFKPVHEMRLEDWQWVLSVNLFGVIHGIHAFLPRMRAQGGEAHIVNTASVAGLFSMREATPLPAYVTSKFAVVGLSEALREELAPEGIGVSVLCPGGVNTRIVDAERNRPPELRGSAAAPTAPTGARPAPPPPDPDDPTQERLSPEDVAQLVLDAVRRNDPYVLTHPGWKTLVRERHEGLERAFDEAAARRAD